MSIFKARYLINSIFKVSRQRCEPHVASRAISFFSRKKTEKTHEEDVDSALTPPPEGRDRKYRQGEDGELIAANLNQLASKTRLTTKKGYRVPEDVEQRLQNIVSTICQHQDNWKATPLTDARVKYKVLSKLIEEFKHDIPNFELSQMKSVEDALKYFQTKVRETTTYEDLSLLDLPKNLHIQLEYERFDPETDKMHGGRTAFPGQDTVVTSIKYRRKYSSIKTTKEKPGFVNHYYDY